MADADQENVLPGSSQDFPPSSPLVPSSTSLRRSSTKLKKAPPVTPRRFNKFFSPRTTRIDSSAARQLKDITTSGANRLKPLGFDDIEASRGPKRRRLSTDTVELPSSPPYSSPLKNSISPRTLRSAARDVYPPRIQRSRVHECYRSRTIPSHGQITADYYSAPEHAYDFDNEQLPFCTAACNTNSLVATGCEDGSVSLFDTDTTTSNFTTPFLSFQPHENAVMDMSFSEDDMFLATGSGDQTGKITDMLTQQVTYILGGHNASIKQISFQPQTGAKVVAASSRNGVVGLWDVRYQTNRPVMTVKGPDYGPSDSRLVGMSSTINVAQSHTTSSDKYPTPPSSASPTIRSGSVTSLVFLPNSPHHFLTSADCHAQLQLWDVRGRYSLTRSRSNVPVPVSTTQPLAHHTRNRHFGITSLALNSTGSRVYALCKDNKLYAYSTNHLYLGQAPASARTAGLTGLGPLYAFKTGVNVSSFYVRAACASLASPGADVLAVGGISGPALVSVDERLLGLSRREQEFEAAFSQSPPPVYDAAVTLLRDGHQREVTGVAWSGASGNLVSIGDDFCARVWTRDGEKARQLRLGRRGERAGYGWAEVDEEQDEDEG